MHRAKIDVKKCEKRAIKLGKELETEFTAEEMELIGYFLLSYSAGYRVREKIALGDA